MDIIEQCNRIVALTLVLGGLAAVWFTFCLIIDGRQDLPILNRVADKVNKIAIVVLFIIIWYNGWWC